MLCIVPSYVYIHFWYCVEKTRLCKVFAHVDCIGGSRRNILRGQNQHFLGAKSRKQYLKKRSKYGLSGDQEILFLWWGISCIHPKGQKGILGDSLALVGATAPLPPSPWDPPVVDCHGLWDCGPSHGLHVTAHLVRRQRCISEQAAEMTRLHNSRVIYTCDRW